MKKCVKITVYGSVQGVGYREYVQKYAKKYDIEGVIQNLEDGTVCIYAAGSPENLDNLIDHIYQGTPEALIEEVAIEVTTTPRDFRGVFRVLGSDGNAL